MHLNIFVIVRYFVGRVLLPLLIKDFIMYAATVKRVELIVVDALSLVS